MNQLINATIEIVEMSDKKGQYGLLKKIKQTSTLEEELPTIQTDEDIDPADTPF